MDGADATVYVWLFFTSTPGPEKPNIHHFICSSWTTGSFLYGDSDYFGTVYCESYRRNGYFVVQNGQAPNCC